MRSGTYRLHADEDANPVPLAVVTADPPSGNGCRPCSRARSEAALLFSTSLSDVGMTRETAARCLGVSKTRVNSKCDPGKSDATLTVADMLDLVDSGGMGLDVVEAVLRRVQDRVDRRRGVAPPKAHMLPRIVLYVSGLVGEMASVVSMVGVEEDEELKVMILDKAAKVHAQVARLEACVRGAG